MENLYCRSVPTALHLDDVVVWFMIKWDDRMPQAKLRGSPARRTEKQQLVLVYAVSRARALKANAS